MDKKQLSEKHKADKHKQLTDSGFNKMKSGNGYFFPGVDPMWVDELANSQVLTSDEEISDAVMKMEQPDFEGKFKINFSQDMLYPYVLA